MDRDGKEDYEWKESIIHRSRALNEITGLKHGIGDFSRWPGTGFNAG